MPEWQRPVAAGVPGAGDCDVWRIDLDAVEGIEAALHGDGPLDLAERQRAARFVFERDRRRFVASRLALRRILGAALGVAAAALVIDAPPLQRPRLAGAADVDFNLSHSGSLALVALSRAAPLGIDVETWRAVPDAAALAARLFTVAERAQMEAVVAGPAQAVDFDRAFLTCWTRKEAVLKSTGAGLAVEPGSVDVGVTPAPRALRFVDRGVDGAPASDVPLRVESFAVGSEGVGAIALPPGVRVGRWLHGLPA